MNTHTPYFLQLLAINLRLGRRKKHNEPRSTTDVEMRALRAKTSKVHPRLSLVSRLLASLVKLLLGHSSRPVW